MSGFFSWLISLSLVDVLFCFFLDVPLEAPVESTYWILAFGAWFAFSFCCSAHHVELNHWQCHQSHLWRSPHYFWSYHQLLRFPRYLLYELHIIWSSYHSVEKTCTSTLQQLPWTVIVQLYKNKNRMQLYKNNVRMQSYFAVMNKNFKH